MLIYEKKYEKTLPPHLLALIEEARKKEMEENRRRERERAERRADTFSSLARYHILFGRKKITAVTAHVSSRKKIY